MKDFQPKGGGELMIRVVAMPRDTNRHGDMFGGWIMSQVDIAGSMPAYRHAGIIATVAVNHFRFLKPVYVGDTLSCYAKITYVGNTSIRVAVEAYVERDGVPEPIQIADAELTYVAVDENNQPRAVPPLSL